MVDLLRVSLIILGVPFIGSANTSMFDGVTVPPNLEEYFTENNVEVVGNYSGSVGELNLEKIAELEPDLIIMNIKCWFSMKDSCSKKVTLLLFYRRRVFTVNCGE